MPTQEELLAEFETYARKATDLAALMQHISEWLHKEKARYNWVGFYLMEAPAYNTLVRGPYVGSFIGTLRIPLDQGLYGAAATQRKTVVVNDVPHDLRYLGSDIVKSNIVVPIFVDKRVMAELCIESYFAGAFLPAEQSFIESCAAVVERFMKKEAGKQPGAPA
jgi:L-methionine (R)-S-oxide reductase